MRNRYKPYIRRANGRERSSSFRVAFRLAWMRERRKPFYVLVQRGFPNHAVAVELTRAALKESILGVRRGGFEKWPRRIKAFGQLK